jgi:hypothetical protein
VFALWIAPKNFAQSEKPPVRKNRQSDYFRRRLAPRNLGRGLASSLQDIGWSGSHVRRHEARSGIADTGGLSSRHLPWYPPTTPCRTDPGQPQTLAAFRLADLPQLCAMSTKSREAIYGSSIRASAERATAARKEADRLASGAWNQRMLGYRGPAQPSSTLGDALYAGYLYLEVRCLGCDTHQTVGAGYRARGEEHADPRA